MEIEDFKYVSMVSFERGYIDKLRRMPLEERPVGPHAKYDFSGEFGHLDQQSCGRPIRAEDLAFVLEYLATMISPAAEACNYSYYDSKMIDRMNMLPNTVGIPRSKGDVASTYFPSSNEDLYQLLINRSYYMLSKFENPACRPSTRTNASLLATDIWLLLLIISGIRWNSRAWEESTSSVNYQLATDILSSAIPVPTDCSPTQADAMSVFAETYNERIISANSQAGMDDAQIHELWDKINPEDYEDSSTCRISSLDFSILQSIYGFLKGYAWYQYLLPVKLCWIRDWGGSYCGDRPAETSYLGSHCAICFAESTTQELVYWSQGKRHDDRHEGSTTIRSWDAPERKVATYTISKYHDIQDDTIIEDDPQLFVLEERVTGNVTTITDAVVTRGGYNYPSGKLCICLPPCTSELITLDSAKLEIQFMQKVGHYAETTTRRQDGSIIQAGDEITDGYRYFHKVFALNDLERDDEGGYVGFVDLKSISFGQIPSWTSSYKYNWQKFTGISGNAFKYSVNAHFILGKEDS